MREETTDLRVGGGRIRWADSEAKVKRQYPENRPGTAYEGTNPQTGEPFSVGSGVVIPAFDVIGDSIRISAFVDFDPDGVTTVDLQAEPASEVSDPDRWPEVVVDAAARLGERLGFGPVDSELMEQDWEVNGVGVSLELESSGFQLTIEPRP